MMDGKGDTNYDCFEQISGHGFCTQDLDKHVPMTPIHSLRQGNRILESYLR